MPRRHSLARLAAVAVLFIAALSASAASNEKTLKAGDAAPAIDGKVWINKDGKAPDLSNKIYIVEFWFAADGPSNSTAPKLSQLAQKYADKGLIVVAVSFDNEQKVRDFKRKHSIGDEIHLLADARPLVKAFGVLDYPTAFLVGKDGKVIYVGQPANQDFQKAVDKAMK